jgi:hypothetical protein
VSYGLKGLDITTRQVLEHAELAIVLALNDVLDLTRPLIVKKLNAKCSNASQKCCRVKKKHLPMNRFRRLVGDRFSSILLP